MPNPKIKRPHLTPIWHKEYGDYGHELQYYHFTECYSMTIARADCEYFQFHCKLENNSKYKWGLYVDDKMNHSRRIIFAVTMKELKQLAEELINKE